MRKAPDKRAPKLPDEVRWRLERGNGYLDLKMAGPARRELEQIPDRYHADPTFLRVQLQLMIAEQRWTEAVAIAARLREAEPNEPIHLIQLAYAVRRAESIEAARVVLLEGLKQFPKVAVIPFNLACYECQMGHKEAALKYLQRTFAIDPGWRTIAVEDEDLKSLWPQLEA